MKRLIYILSLCGMLWDATCLAPVMEYADATTDTGFKQLLSNINVGKSIIETITQAVGITITINRIARQSAVLPILKIGREKQTFMDYHVMTDTGEHIVVEMQVKRHAYFDERAVFYLASVFASQVKADDFKEGDWYKKIKRVIAIQFVKYDSNKIRGIDGDDPMLARVRAHPMATDQYMKHYVFTDKLSGQEIDCIQMIQVELPRADRILQLSPESSNGFNELVGWWLSLINHSARYCSTDIIDAPEIVQQGFKQLKYSEWNPEIQKEYEDDIIDREKYATVLAVERNEGREEGRAEGLAEGEIKGAVDADYDRFKKAVRKKEKKEGKKIIPYEFKLSGKVKRYSKTVVERALSEYQSEEEYQLFLDNLEAIKAQPDSDSE